MLVASSNIKVQRLIALGGSAFGWPVYMGDTQLTLPRFDVSHMNGLSAQNEQLHPGDSFLGEEPGDIVGEV